MGARARRARAAGARAIAYDRRGYGASGAPEPYAATTVQEQSEDAAALLPALGAAPAVLVGEGFGALVVLELLVRRPQLASAAVLADPPLFAFVPAATEALAAERTLLEQALRDGGPGDAIDALARRRRRRRRRERARAARLGFFADYAGQLELVARRAASCARSRCRSPSSPARRPRPTSSRPPRPPRRSCPDVRRSTDGDVIAAARALLA